MITAVFSGSVYARATGLWQYDYGQILRIQGLSLQKAVKIDFSLSETGSESVSRVGITKDSITDVPIPDSMLENGDTTMDYDIYAFVYIEDETSGKTTHRITMPVTSRPKPEAFDTPEDAQLFKDAIAAVNESAGRAETAEKLAEEKAGAANDAMEQAQRLADQVNMNADAVNQDVIRSKEYLEQATKSAAEALQSEQAAKYSETAAQEAQAGAEAAEMQAELHALDAAASASGAELAKTQAQESAQQASEDREAVQNLSNGFSATCEKAIRDIHTAGEEQINAVSKAGDDQVVAVQAAAEEIIEDRGKIQQNESDIRNLKEYVTDVHPAIAWREIAAAVRTELAPDMFTIGDEFTNVWADTAANKTYDNPLRVNHFENVELEDGSTIPGMWLQTHYAHAFGVQFSHQQAFYVSEEGMEAGTYCVLFDYNWGNNGYVNKGDYWNFTLTKDVPTGGKLAGFYAAPDQAPANWKVYVYDSDARTILETVTVSSGQSGTLLGTMTAYGDDALNGLQQAAYGNNRWATSALRQYLNSDQPKGLWWTPQNKWDIAPDQLSAKDGYLCGLDSELLEVLRPVKITTYCNTVTQEGKAQVQDITYDKVILPSLEQMYVNPQIAGEGEVHAYYRQLNGTETKYQQYQTYEELKTYAVENHTSAQHVRLRSANRGNAYNTWNVNSSGNVNNNNASNANRFAPIVLFYRSHDQSVRTAHRNTKHKEPKSRAEARTIPT